MYTKLIMENNEGIINSSLKSSTPVNIVLGTERVTLLNTSPCQKFKPRPSWL